MERTILGFEHDEEGEVVARLDCGHRRHVRHRPPFEDRPWVTSEEGRAGRLGSVLECRLCDQDGG